MQNYVTLESLGLQTDGSYDMKKLHSQPAKRQPVSSETTVEAAKKAKASDWYITTVPTSYLRTTKIRTGTTHFLVRRLCLYPSVDLVPRD